ncbi:uncharacterized protein [Dysidea avara]|uniref:uncharacterized protein n=1 Tax=Dysidea avara TaxID=196820 RepID=UPI00332A8002
MRVDLAVQTLSESVAVALDLKFGEVARETVKFIRHMDHFFDCFNVSSFTKGKEKRKCFLSPYRKENDFRMGFLKELVCYLDQWKASVEGRPGFDDDQKQRMLLSATTENGIRITVKSFLELVPFLLSIDGVSVFLSEKVSQDSVEKYFSMIRQHGRANENPTITQVLKNAQNIRVINSIWVWKLSWMQEEVI